MKDVEFPSEAAPGPTPVKFGIPDDWTVGQAPGTLMVVRSSTPLADGFVPNVVVAQRRVDGAADPKELAEAVLEQLRQQDQFSLVFKGMLTEGLDLGFVFEYAFRHQTQGVALAQVQMHLMTHVNESVYDVTTLTGTAGPVDTAEQMTVLRSIVQSALQSV